MPLKHLDEDDCVLGPHMANAATADLTILHCFACIMAFSVSKQHHSGLSICCVGDDRKAAGMLKLVHERYRDPIERQKYLTEFEEAQINNEQLKPLLAKASVTDAGKMLSALTGCATRCVKHLSGCLVFAFMVALTTSAASLRMPATSTNSMLAFIMS